MLQRWQLLQAHDGLLPLPWLLQRWRAAAAAGCQSMQLILLSCCQASDSASVFPFLASVFPVLVLLWPSLRLALVAMPLAVGNRFQRWPQALNMHGDGAALAAHEVAPRPTHIALVVVGSLVITHTRLILR